MVDVSIRKVQVNSTQIPDSSLAWKLNTYSGTETQTFYLNSESGHFFLIQIAYSTMSWTPSAQSTCRIYSPDGKEKSFSNNHGTSDLVFSDDNRSIKTPSLSFKLQSTDPIKYKISLSMSGLVFDLTFETIDRGFQINDGKTSFDLDDESFGYVQNWFIPKAKVEGYMNLDGKNIDLKANGSFVYACQSKPQSVGRWNFVNFQSATDALTLYQFEIPKYSPDTGEISMIDSGSFGSLILNGKLESIMLKNYSIFSESTIDSFSGYNIPKSITHSWSGNTISGKSISIKMTLSLSNLVAKLDVLSELPYLIRVFLQTFITAPFVYQWTDSTTVSIEVDNEKMDLSGCVFSEIAFMREFPSGLNVLE